MTSRAVTNRSWLLGFQGLESSDQNLIETQVVIRGITAELPFEVGRHLEGQRFIGRGP
jgi:hypothetical protein